MAKMNIQECSKTIMQTDALQRFRTPFFICGGRVVDREYHPVELHPERFRLTDDEKAAEAFLNHCCEDGINLIHVEFTESLLTEANGALKSGPALDLLDEFMDACFQNGFYVVFTPISEKIRIPDGRSENAIRDDEPIFAERYFDALFRRVNPLSGKRFFEYENIIGIEYILALESFTALRLGAYLHHLGCFVQHFFLDQLLELIFLDRGPIPEELRDTIEAYTQLQMVDWFPREENLKIPSRLDGIPRAQFTAWVRETGKPNYLSCPAAAAASKSLWNGDPRANGGAEGFLTLETSVSTDFLLEFPCEIRSAKYRPSMRNNVPVRIRDRCVSFSLEQPRYGVLEINYGEPEIPHFTVYIFADPIIVPPSEARWLEPGVHEEIDYTSAHTVAFKPGVHYLPEDRLRPVSGHDIYLAPGAVLKCGLTCEKGENIRIYGSGIFDGTLSVRHPGENWKGRADDSFIHFFEGRNIVWDGPMIFNSPFWNFVPEGTHDMTIRHHKAVTWAVNSDGIQPRSCVNLLIEDCFLKCSDDAIAIKTRRASGMHSHHITVRNLVTWNDAGSALEIGHTSQGDLLEDVLFENIEIVRIAGGMCHIYLIDHSEVRNVRYENIYVDSNPFNLPEVSFTISENFYSTDDTRAKIHHILLKNLHVDGTFQGVNLEGFDDDHRIEEVTIDGVFVHHPDRIETYQGKIPYKKRKFADEVKFVK